MNWTIYAKSPIARLPRPLQKPALLVRNLVGLLPRRLSQPVYNLVERSGRHWTYNADGLATAHYSPFTDDAEFTRRYDEMSAEWFPGTLMEARWRLSILTRYALYARGLPGNYAEFGVFRGGCSRMVLGIAQARAAPAALPVRHLLWNSRHQPDGRRAGPGDGRTAG